MIARCVSLLVIVLCCAGVSFGARTHVVNPLSGSVVKVGPDGSVYVLSGGYTAAVTVTRLSSDGTQILFQTGVTGMGNQPVGTIGPPQYLLYTPITLAIGPDSSTYVAYGTQNSQLGDSVTLVKLSITGQVVKTFSPPQPPSGVSYSSGGSYLTDLAVDSGGNVIMTGSAQATASAGSLSNSAGSGYVMKVDPALANVLWVVSGYSGNRIATDPQGNVYMVGLSSAAIPTSSGAFQEIPKDATCSAVSCVHQYVEAIDASGKKLLYATYLSGSGTDAIGGIAVDAAGNAWVAGSTVSADYPVTADALQGSYPGKPGLLGTAYSTITGSGFVSKLNATGTSLLYSTYFGGSAADQIRSIAVDGAGDVFVAGSMGSIDFPGMTGGERKCAPDGFVARLAGNVVDAAPVSVANANPASIAVGPGGFVYAAGAQVVSPEFGVAPAGVACYARSTDLLVNPGLVPGELVTLFGNGMAPTAMAAVIGNNTYPSQSNGVVVKVNGIPAPLLYTSPDQINFQVPFEVAAGTQVSLTLTTDDPEGQADRNTQTVPVFPNLLSAFQIPADTGCSGYYPGLQKTLVINADGTVNSCSNPAAPNSIVSFLVNGAGTYGYPAIDGLVLTSNESLLGFTPDQVGGAVPSLVSLTPTFGDVGGVYTITVQAPAQSVSAEFLYFPWGSTHVAFTVGTK